MLHTSSISYKQNFKEIQEVHFHVFCMESELSGKRPLQQGLLEFVEGGQLAGVYGSEALGFLAE
jgi:hypothetical protein